MATRQQLLKQSQAGWPPCEGEAFFGFSGKGRRPLAVSTWSGSKLIWPLRLRRRPELIHYATLLAQPCAKGG